MVLRSFFAIDSDKLVVSLSSDPTIVGNSIINNSSTPDGTVFTFSGGGGTTVTLNDTGGRRNRFEDDDENDHVITDGGGIVANGTEVEAESLIYVRALDVNGNPTGPTITLTVFSQGGVTGDVWGFASETEMVSGVSYVKTGGSNTGTSRYNDFVTCFGPGTLIRTPVGDCPIETLSTGDLVWTRDGGALPIKWIGRTTVAASGSFAPVVFDPGTIGNDRTLVVSQEHRMFIASPRAEILFGQAEVLVAAKHLCGLRGVQIREQQQICYSHLMFDSHQIISANGSLSESFFLSEHALAGVSDGQHRELLALFPTLRSGVDQFGATAAMTLKKPDAMLLCSYLA